MKRRALLRSGAGMIALASLAGCTSSSANSPSTTEIVPTSTAPSTSTEQSTTEAPSTTESYPTAEVGQTIETAQFALTMDGVKRKHVLEDSDSEETYQLPDGQDLLLGAFTIENISGSVQQTLDAYIYFFADGEQQKPVISAPYGESSSVPISFTSIVEGLEGNTLGELHAERSTRLWIATLVSGDPSSLRAVYIGENDQPKAEWTVS